MKKLYNLEEATSLLHKNKMMLLCCVFSGIETAVIVFILTWMYQTTWVMIIDMILTCIFLFFVITYVFYLRKKYLSKYHFLAKIQHYEHEIVKDYVVEISTNPITISTLSVVEIHLSKNQIIYLETTKRGENISIHSYYAFELVDNIIVGYEEISNG